MLPAFLCIGRLCACLWGIWKAWPVQVSRTAKYGNFQLPLGYLDSFPRMENMLFLQDNLQKDAGS